ncbi:MAG: NAD(P)-dependent oxidoreductase [Coriobacteriales bacterium]|nr:NAD(P)-dependent oxidoreductase [Coriobacteriales bacterium]
MSIVRMRNVAFIGTGIMGAAIVGHLMDAGYKLTVYNRTKDKAQPLLDRGATWADSVAEAARNADVVFTMVGYPKDVEDVYLSTDGLLAATRKGAWMIDLTTSSPQLARDIHGVAEVTDRHAVDCPVTGGEEGAIAGTLTLMLGCTQKEAEPIVGLLGTFSQKIFYFDAPGAGQTAKLCNQISLAACMVGYAEALALANQSGLDPAAVRELVLSGTGASGAMDKLAPLSLDGDYKPRFRSEHLLKDLGIALAAADELELNLPGTGNARDLYNLLCEVGGGQLGSQAVSLMYEDEQTCAAAGLDWSLVQ